MHMQPNLIIVRNFECVCASVKITTGEWKKKRKTSWVILCIAPGYYHVVNVCLCGELLASKELISNGKGYFICQHKPEFVDVLAY